MHKSSEPILHVKNLSLSFPRKLYHSSNLRDVFIRSLKGVRETEEKVLILDNINFKIHKGERLGIIAKNGTGKSTLCRCISGYYEPLRGEIIRNGKMRALYESSLAYFPELSGRENMKLLSDFFYDDNKEQLINESIKFSELKESIDAPIKTYSKGMLLRLSLSLLSAMPTDLLILDEVFEGADEFFSKKLSKRIRNLINKSGAVILVSHHEQHIMEICTRVIVLKNGKIIFDGEPQEAYKVYRNSEN